MKEIFSNKGFRKFINSSVNLKLLYSPWFLKQNKVIFAVKSKYQSGQEYKVQLYS
jgi:hypothetical protein